MLYNKMGNSVKTLKIIFNHVIKNKNAIPLLTTLIGNGVEDNF